MAEQLQGLAPRTHLGRLLDRLEIGLIEARSPQAKGRVERLFGTFQDRLVKELRRVQASSLEEANAALAKYLPRHNKRFTKAAAQPGSAYRPRCREPKPVPVSVLLTGGPRPGTTPYPSLITP